jgi:hypothetical protein
VGWEFCCWSVCYLIDSYFVAKSLAPGVEPRYMGISPVFAIPKLLDQLGLSKEDIDVYEVRSKASNILNAEIDTLYRSMKHLHRNLRIVWRSYEFRSIKSTRSALT